ncbi:MAG: ABC transporter permease subunit [Oligoflexia bacterium]|nr:ABC transporter permease subunit [Oligoflexia bacterium]
MFKIFLFSILFSFSVLSKPTLVIGSKVFTESYILAEIIAQIAENTGEVKVARRFGLGATGITYKSLETDEISLYPEYTGTIAQSILKNDGLKDWANIKSSLLEKGFDISDNLGFNNTYALAMKKVRAIEKSVKKISDLVPFDQFEFGFTHEFLKRADGFEKLKIRYELQPKSVIGIEHSLAYEALVSDKIDVMEVYSTDAKISKYNLRVLEDDLSFFPLYEAVLFYKKDFKKKFPKTYSALNDNLVGKINNDLMIKLNSLVENEGKSFEEAAKFFLGEKITDKKFDIPLSKITKLSVEHLKLVSISLFFSIVIGLILGIIAFKYSAFGQLILGITGVFQTIPSLALLCFLIPFFGIGNPPAYMALFLYGLLPIVRNTYLGLSEVPNNLKEISHLMGMSSFERLTHLEFPLAFKAILSGIQTSAVINVGTATLAAFIGAGGLGTLINTGLALNDTKIILTGAVPAAILAVLVHLMFQIIDNMNFFRKD